jgi:lipopolysaccharide exporter
MPDAGEDALTSAEAGGRVIRGSAARVVANVAGTVLGLATATLLLRHLGVDDSGRYVTVLSLVAIAVAVVDIGLNVTASSELARHEPGRRRELVANVLAQRLLVAPLALLALVAFAVAAGYPSQMVAGTALAGTGVLIVAVANALLVPLTVQLRNAGLAFVDFLRQAVTLAGVALLAALGARLTPFFAVQVAVGLAVVAVTPLLVGRGGLVRPRFDRAEQRMLLGRALPVAAALALGQVYVRLVIVLMSLISSAQQTGYFGGSLRAMDAVVALPALVASVALPLLAAAARDDRARLRYAVEGLGEGAVIAGVLVVLVAVRAAEPVMAAIGGPAFRPAGDVLRIQVAALLFIALYQIWTMALIALGRQRQLILTNALGLLGVAVFAAALVPPFGAQGGAAASVLGDALLAGLIYWRMHHFAGRVRVRLGFLARVATAAAAGGGALLVPGLPDLAAAALAGTLFLGVGWLIGMVPSELRELLGPGGMLAWRGRRRRGPAKLDADTTRIAIAALLGVAFVVVLAVDQIGGDGSSGAGSSQPGEQTVTLSEADLLERADALGHVAYWVGPRPGTDRYELQTDANGNIFVRYLTAGATARDPRSDFLTVGTYPVPEASKALEQAARTTGRDQALSRHEGFEALSSTDAAYVVFDQQPELQVEVYSPRPGEAAELATSGALTPLR